MQSTFLSVTWILCTRVKSAVLAPWHEEQSGLPFRLQFLPGAEQGVRDEHEADEAGIRQVPEAE